MIRIILSITRILLAAVLALLLGSCKFDIDAFSGSGNVRTETRNVGGKFTRVSADNGLDVVIIQGETVNVTVEADDNLLPHITTEVKGNTLEISCEYQNFLNVGSKKVTVKMPVVEGLTTDGGSSMTFMNVLRSEDLDLDASSGSSISGEVEADRLDAQTSSGASITLKGKAIQYEASSSSGSHIDSKGLIANEVEAEASSGSSISVNPTQSLKGKASSGASVHYPNEPKNISRDESSGGTVSKE